MTKSLLVSAVALALIGCSETPAPEEKGSTESHLDDGDDSASTDITSDAVRETCTDIWANPDYANLDDSAPCPPADADACNLTGTRALKFAKCYQRAAGENRPPGMGTASIYVSCSFGPTSFVFSLESGAQYVCQSISEGDWKSWISLSCQAGVAVPPEGKSGDDVLDGTSVGVNVGRAGFGATVSTGFDDDGNASGLQVGVGIGLSAGVTLQGCVRTN